MTHAQHLTQAITCAIIASLRWMRIFSRALVM
jgi:hypothetical protein